MPNSSIGNSQINVNASNTSVRITQLGGALKGLAINFGIDVLRATSNWALASQISDLNNAMLCKMKLLLQELRLML